MIHWITGASDKDHVQKFDLTAKCLCINPEAKLFDILKVFLDRVLLTTHVFSTFLQQFMKTIVLYSALEMRQNDQNVQKVFIEDLKKKHLCPKSTSVNLFESQNNSANPHEASVWWFKHAVWAVCLGWGTKFGIKGTVFSVISLFFSYYCKCGLLIQDGSSFSCPCEFHSYMLTWEEQIFFPGNLCFFFILSIWWNSPSFQFPHDIDHCSCFLCSPTFHQNAVMNKADFKPIPSLQFKYSSIHTWTKVGLTQC